MVLVQIKFRRAFRPGKDISYITFESNFRCGELDPDLALDEVNLSSELLIIMLISDVIMVSFINGLEKNKIMINLG